MEWRKMFSFGAAKKETDELMAQVHAAKRDQTDSKNRLERIIQQTIDARRRDNDKSN